MLDDRLHPVPAGGAGDEALRSEREREDLAARQALAQRKLSRLDELADLAMDVARAVRKEAMAAADAAAEGRPGPSAAAAAQVFDRVARAVRHTLILQTRIEAEGEATRAEVLDRAERRRAEAARRAEAQRQAARHATEKRLSDMLPRVIGANLPEPPPMTEAEIAAEEAAYDPYYPDSWIDPEDENDEPFSEIHDAIRSRLDEHPDYADHLDRPVEETIDRLCRDLGLNPQWRRRFAGEQLREQRLGLAADPSPAAGEPAAAAKPAAAGDDDRPPGPAGAPAGASAAPAAADRPFPAPA